MKKNAFTLVEMLVVISILSIFSMLILTIFTRTLKGGNKSQIIGAIKQNGQSVLEIMDKTVRNSDNIICPKLTSSATDTLVVVKNGAYTRFKFFAPSDSSNGKIQQDFPVKPTSSQIKTFLEDNICTDPMGTDSIISPQTLTATNIQTGISVENGVFTRDRPAGFKDQVTIKFELKPGVGAPQSVAGQIDPVSFQTTIQIR